MNELYGEMILSKLNEILKVLREIAREINVR